MKLIKRRRPRGAHHQVADLGLEGGPPEVEQEEGPSVDGRKITLKPDCRGIQPFERGLDDLRHLGQLIGLERRGRVVERQMDRT